MNSPAKKRVDRRVPSGLKAPPKAFLASVFLHLFFLFLLSHRWVEHSVPPKSVPIEVTIQETAPKNESEGVRGAIRQKIKSGAAKRGKIQLLDLMPGPGKLNPVEGSERDAGGEVQSLTSFGRGTKELGLYNYIYRTLEPHVTFPEELRTRGIHGDVTADVVFSPDGEYLRSASAFTSNNNYLKVLVLRILRAAFADKLNGNFLKNRKNTIAIRCHFEFDITEHDDKLLAARRNYVTGNNLRFYRYFQDSKLSWSLGPLHGWGVFPALDLLWFAKLAKKDREADPLVLYTQDPEW